MIGLVGSVESGVPIGEAAPIELAAVHDNSTHSSPVAAHKLGQRVDHDIRTKGDRTQQDWRRNRVVHDQRHTALMRHGGNRLDVAHISRRVAYTFAEDCPGILIYELL